MTPLSGSRILYLLGLVLVGVFTGAVGFEAGRRYPFVVLERLLAERRGEEAGWPLLPPGPGPRYESSVAVVGGSLYVFGGFTGRELHASATVYRWNSESGGWSRLADMPSPTTHRNPAVAGDTVWLAGGFVGQSPGPATDEVWAYLTSRDEWVRGTPLPGRRGSGGLAAIGNALHYFSGYSEDRQTAVPDHWVIAREDAFAGRPAWRAAAPFPLPRGHMAALVLGDHIYAIGGTLRHDPEQVDVSNVHRYDPRSDTWTEITSLPEPRSHAEPGTFARNGRIYLVGGRSWPTYRQSMRDLTIYYPDLDRWLAGPLLPRPLMAAVGAAVGDSIIVGLGAETAVATDSTFWLWEDRGGWWPGAELPQAIGEVAGGIIGNRMILVGERSDRTLIYDLGTGRWEEPGGAARRPAPGHHHAAEVLDGELYLLGGIGRAAGIMQIYDPERNAWRFGPDLPFAAGSSASTVIGGRIYVAGGISRGSTVGTLARYDPSVGQWTLLDSMPLPRNHAAAATDGRRFYVFGGRGPGSGDANVVANGFADVQIYDPDAGSWTVSDGSPGSPAPLPQARGGMGKAVYLDGEFYVMGGETADGPGATRERVYSRVDVYDPSANQWRSAPPLPTARHGIFPLALGDRIYVGGGGIRAGASASAVLEILTLPAAGNAP